MARNSRLLRLSEQTSRAGLGVRVIQPLIRETVLTQTNSDSSAQRELLYGEFVREMLRSAGTGGRECPPRSDQPRGRDRRWRHMPSVRLRSLISPRQQSPAAAGRLRARISVPEQQGGITFLATAPCSPLARRPLSLLLRGRLRARRAQANLPWRPPPAAAPAPLPSAPCPMQGRSSRGAAPARPQRPQLPASPFLVFPFRNSPL